MFSYKDSLKNFVSLSQGVTTTYLKRATISDSESRLNHEIKKLLQHCPDHERKRYADELEGFIKLFHKYIQKSEPTLHWDEIEPLPPGSLMDLNNFVRPRRDAIRDMLNKLVVIKLNGGLGTTMRCDGPKSLIPVRCGLTFLDLTVQQIENLNMEFDANVPLVLMNSFNTEDSTDKILNKYRNLKLKIHSFMQNRYPRIFAEDLIPLPQSYSDTDPTLWYPPGHGNFYEAFYNSKLLDAFIKEGREYCFVSNIDNLGATVDFTILNHLLNPRVEPPPEFVMEVTDKTPADIKGGTIIQYKGKLKLLEYAQVPKEHIDEFKCSRKFKVFNTNNLWMKLEAIIRLVKEDKMSLDVIENKKQVIYEGERKDIIQLETASGAAIQLFDGAIGVLVPRSRFLPVKSTSDLFLLKSNIYITENGKVIMNPLRPFPSAPLIRLADDHFGNIRELEKRFDQIPDCLDLHHLTVSGDVTFGKDVSLKGNVTIIADYGQRINIPRGSVLQSKIITGSLRIVDH